MGLFDSLKKNLGSIADELSSHKDDLQKELQRFQSQQSHSYGNSYQSGTDSSAKPQYTTQRVYPESYDQSRRIEEILSRNFPEFVIRRDVAVNELLPGVNPSCEPITFLLCRDDRACLAIVLTIVSRHSGLPLKGTDAACRQLGIPYMHLYQEYENAEGYIVDKINSLL